MQQVRNISKQSLLYHRKTRCARCTPPFLAPARACEDLIWLLIENRVDEDDVFVFLQASSLLAKFLGLRVYCWGSVGGYVNSTCHWWLDSADSVRVFIHSIFFLTATNKDVCLTNMRVSLLKCCASVCKVITTLTTSEMFWSGAYMLQQQAKATSRPDCEQVWSPRLPGFSIIMMTALHSSYKLNSRFVM